MLPKGGRVWTEPVQKENPSRAAKPIAIAICGFFVRNDIDSAAREILCALTKEGYKWARQSLKRLFS